MFVLLNFECEFEKEWFLKCVSMWGVGLCSYIKIKVNSINVGKKVVVICRIM